MMKTIRNILRMLLLVVLVAGINPEPLAAAANPVAASQSAAQKKKAKAAAKKAKEKEKKQKAKEKAAAKKAKDKAKAADKKAKDKAKAAAKKQKAKDKTAKEKAKAQLKKTKEAQKKALAKQKEQEKKALAKQKEQEKKMKEQAKNQPVQSARTTNVGSDTPALQETVAQTTTPSTTPSGNMAANAAETTNAATAPMGTTAPTGKLLKGSLKSSTDLHYLVLWGGAGYSGMLDNYKSASETASAQELGFSNRFVGGGGGKLGIGYGLKHKSFIFHVGPEFRIFSSQDNLHFENPYVLTHPDYTSMQQFYYMNKMRETQTIGQVMLPIMAGMNIDKYYWMAGVKVGYAVVGNYHQRAKMTTAVLDNMAIDEWTDMLNHYQASDVEMANHPLHDGIVKGKNAFGLDVAFSVEGGIILNEFLKQEWRDKNAASAHPWTFRLGAFVEYGLPLADLKQGIPLATFSGFEGHRPSVMSTGSIHKSEWASGKLSSLLVGVKLTAEMQLNQPQTPDPRMTVYVHNKFTGETISTARVEVIDPYSDRSLAKNVSADGGMQERIPRGDYHLMATAVGYLPGEVVHYTLAEDLRDTVHLELIPQPMLTAYVHDAKTEVLLAAELTYTSNQDKEEYEAYSYGDQPARISLPYGEDFEVKIEAEGYHPLTTTISDLYSTSHYRLTPLVRVRRTLVLKNMYFATAKAIILPGSEEDIEKLYNFLVENPAIRVQIIGHTDSQGSENYNQKLSEARALSLKNVMIERGIDGDRIETDGMGESMPIDTNETEAGRQNNRRIEVTILNAEDAEEDVY